MQLSLHAVCCCASGELDYYILEPCYFQGVGSKKYMTAAAFATCGFSKKLIYKNGYCGYWRNSAIIGDTLDETCGNYVYNAAGCCGGPFDPCPGTTDCCGYEDCMDYRESNSLGVPLNLTGYTATVGSAGSSWSVSVTNVSTSTPTFPTAGDPKFEYDVTVTFLFSWSAPGGTIDCDGSPTPSLTSFDMTFKVTHDIAVNGCPDTSAVETGTSCDNLAAVCAGTTTTTGSGFTACDVVEASLSGSQTMTTAAPDFQNDCTPPGTPYTFQTGIGLTISPNLIDPNGCVTGCTSSAWASAYFPDVSASLTLTIVGIWQ